MEEWKDIKGYEGLYQVSNKGNVRSLMFTNNIVSKKRTKILKLNYSKRTKRLYIDLKSNKKRVHKTVHRLVAEAFIPNPYNYPVVNHKDGIPTNNNVNNLEWCSYSYNSKHAYNMGLASKFILMNNNAKKKIIREDGKEYNCASECAKDLGVSISAIRHVLSGRNKTCCGYKIQFVERL